MIAELQLAQRTEDDDQKLMQHVASVRLLCEVILDDRPSPSHSPKKKEISDEELKAMLGKTERKPIAHDDVNGDSIFDF